MKESFVLVLGDSDNASILSRSWRNGGFQFLLTDQPRILNYPNVRQSPADKYRSRKGRVTAPLSNVRCDFFPRVYIRSEEPSPPGAFRRHKISASNFG